MASKRVVQRYARALLMHHTAKGIRPEDIYIALVHVLIEQDTERARETLIDLDKRLEDKKA